METDRPILHYYTDKKNAGRKKPRGEIELEHCEQVLITLDASSHLFALLKIDEIARREKSDAKLV